MAIRIFGAMVVVREFHKARNTKTRVVRIRASIAKYSLSKYFGLPLPTQPGFCRSNLPENVRVVGIRFFV